VRILLYTGKGGTGKSVISCATGVLTSSLGHETLVISSDPSHTLRDIFEASIREKPTRILSRLWALQVDPIKEVKEKYEVIYEYAASVFKARGLDETLAYEVASLPNMTPFIALLKLVDLVEEGGFDVIILDTVPSGEALKNLYLPSLLGSISRKLLRAGSYLLGVTKVIEPLIGAPTPSKEVILTDLKLIDKLEALKNYLTDDSITSLRLIANPDSFSIENMRRTYITSNLYNINVDLAIVNKVVPDEVSDPYFDQWKLNQKLYLDEAERAFYPLPVKRLKLFKSELKGLSKLEEAGNEMFKGEDPSKVYFKGKPIQIVKTDEGLKLIVKTPFLTSKELHEVERIGDELVVKVDTDVGEVRSFIPLPAIAYSMHLSTAKLLNGELHIYLSK